MMNESNVVLIRRYAQAFFNIFAGQITEDCCTTMKKASRLLQKNTSWQVFFDFSDMGIDQQKHMITILLQRFDLPIILQSLGELLCEHKRMMLFPDVLDKLVAIFFDRNNLVFFTIASFPELTKDELQALTTFLHEKSGKHVRATGTIDNQLIAGIRAHSRSFLWEYSIAKKLREAQQMALNGNNS